VTDPDPARLVFVFDYISPNAYLAWSQLPRLKADYGLEITLMPVLFTGLLRAHGQMGPAEQPAKRHWMSRNIARKAALLDLPLSPPKHHPYNPLLSLRVSSLDLPPEDQWRLVDALMRGLWVQGRHLSEADQVRQSLDETGLDGAGLVAQADTPAARQALTDQTEAAIAQGVFGIPSLLWQGEVFFGYDDIGFLELALKGEDPLVQSEQAQRWVSARYTASSMRREMRPETSPGDAP